MSMKRFAHTCDAIAATTKKLEKTALVATYLKAAPLDEAVIAAIFLSGRPFAAWLRILTRQPRNSFSPATLN